MPRRRGMGGAALKTRQTLRVGVAAAPVDPNCPPAGASSARPGQGGAGFFSAARDPAGGSMHSPTTHAHAAPRARRRGSNKWTKTTKQKKKKTRAAARVWKRAINAAASAYPNAQRADTRGGGLWDTPTSLPPP